MPPRAVAVMVAFALSCFGLLLFLWLSFGGPVPLNPKGYRVNAQFGEATTLATEADVRVSGVPIGKVKRIEPDEVTGLSEVEMEIDAEYVPLRGDVKAILRQKTLLGETYVELTPGSLDADAIPEGGRIPDGAISEAVQLDEIFRAFDPETRAAFQTWMQSQALAVEGRGADINAALGNLAPFAEEAGDLVSILRRQAPAVQALVSDTGQVFDALSERRGQLRTLVTGLDDVFQTTSRRNAELQQIFQILPTFQREARATLTDLDEFSRNTDPLITQLRPVARELSPTLRDLQSIAPDLEGFFRETGTLITASREGFPAAEQLLDDLKPFLGRYGGFADELNPILDYIAPFRRELTAFMANAVGATQATAPEDGRRVHYLRTIAPLLPEILAAYPRRTGANRTNPYAAPGIFERTGRSLPVLENRHCGRPAPDLDENVPEELQDVMPPELVNDINELILQRDAQGRVAAPPCPLQQPQSFQGMSALFPSVEPRE